MQEIAEDAVLKTVIDDQNRLNKRLFNNREEFENLAYLTIYSEDSITRKLKEMITAIQIERTYTKNEILEMYLNTVHFGHGTYGAESAAKRFFNKNASDLTIGE